jgi:hypothetical protein
MSGLKRVIKFSTGVDFQKIKFSNESNQAKRKTWLRVEWNHRTLSMRGCGLPLSSAVGFRQNATPPTI